MEPSDDTNNPFVYHQPGDLQIEVIIKIRSECKLLYDMILKDLPESRYRSLAITKLEEVSMWANKAVAFTL